MAQANAPLKEDKTFVDSLVLCRRGDDYPLLAPNRIDYMDVAPEQLVSIAAALIPFLEHDDANRALMGSNMQRQSVPLLFPQAPIVGTGLESKVARDSGAVIIARRAGTVTRVTADEIIIDAGTAGTTSRCRSAVSRGSTVTGSRSSGAPTRTPPSISARWWRRDRRWRPARSSLTAPRPKMASWPRAERAGGVHAVVRLQLRRRHRPLRAPGQGRRLLVDPHPGTRTACARHQARPGRDHA